MTAIGTLPVLLGTGIHSARPSASAVGKGGLYACSTHSLIYQTDGSSWSTWATLIGTGLSDPMTTRGDVIVRNSSNVTARLGVGAAGKILSSDGTDASWGNGPMTAAGDIIIGGASGLPTRLAAGATSGHVLTSNGSGVAPSYQSAAGGGGLVLLEQHTAASSSSLDFTTAISAAYDEYLIECVGLIFATNSVNCRLRMSTDGGATYDSSAIYSVDEFVTRAGGSAVGGGQGATFISLSWDNADSISNATAAMSFSGSFRLFAPGSAALWKQVIGDFTYMDATPFRVRNTMRGAYESTTAVNAFRIFASSGNIASGTVRVYGVAK